MKNFFVSIAILCLSSQVIAADVWNQKSNLPAEGRHRTTGFSIGNKGYMGLGHYNSGPNGNITKADIWEYDPTNDSWTQKADYGGGATYGATAFTIGQFAYVGAHVYGSSEFYKFDPIANTWTLIAPCPEGGSDHCSFSLNGKGYFIGPNNYYQYKPTNDAWALMGPNPTYVGSWSNAFSVGEKGYLLATNGGGLYEYKEINNSWIYRTSFPGEAQGGWSNFVLNGKAYICSGYIAFLNPTSRQLWEYNPGTNGWNQMEDLPGATRRFSSSFSISNKGYIGTGTNGTNMSDLWEFDQVLTTTSYAPNALTLVVNQAARSIKLYGDDFNQTKKIEVFNLQGQLVSTSENYLTSTDIQLGHLPQGIYICVCTKENQVVFSQKFAL